MNQKNPELLSKQPVALPRKSDEALGAEFRSTGDELNPLPRYDARRCENSTTRHTSQRRCLCAPSYGYLPERKHIFRNAGRYQTSCSLDRGDGAVPLPEQSAVRNRLLKRLSPGDFALLQPHMPIREPFFPEPGEASITKTGPGAIEVGIVEPEGVVGATPMLLGSGLTPDDRFVQNPSGMIAVGVPEILAGTEISPVESMRIMRSSRDRGRPAPCRGGLFRVGSVI
ncbi:hypothetical protein MKK58_22875 [Methylobacterium sp. J-078]|uniref:hypothetical protein n=1 Tax=Methylobacterium sp. J-078 TaxID=2836657 RepID=UPI001FBB17E5|nr:hypothetical protein [Methylobacterium sp. J-078]MCJ2047360.1 hypothetical protein [Methylobacterium sp. J-078]